MTWVWTLLVFGLACFAWYLQRQWELKHPGKRGRFFADSYEERV